MIRKLSRLLALTPLVFTTCVATPAIADDLDSAQTPPSVQNEENPADAGAEKNELGNQGPNPEEMNVDGGGTGDENIPQDDNTTPDPVEQVDVYRVYNPRTGEHLYTDSAVEYSKLVESGWYDEGIAWRSPVSAGIPVYRLHNPSSGEHVYSADAYEISVITTRGWKNEGVFCYSDDEETIPIYRLRNNGAYHLSSSKAEKDALVATGWTNEGIVFYASGEGAGKAWPVGAPVRVTEMRVYRLYNIVSGEHLYTNSATEVATLTQQCWVGEGIGWVSPSWSQIPVYRVYNPASGEHHYTIDVTEITVLVTQRGWKNEGVAWYSSQAQEVPVYRQYKAGVSLSPHHYTSDKREYDTNNARNSWDGEGVGWYAIGGGQSNPSAAVSVQCVVSGIHDPNARNMTELAQNYSSSTEWLILVNNSIAHVGVFHKEHGRWWLTKYWAAGPGADRTPTVKGQFTVGKRGYSFGRGYTCYYWTEFFGDYLFHSILYYQGTMTVKDGTLGRRVSHGCVRLAIENAKWIYDNIPSGTKVVSY